MFTQSLILDAQRNKMLEFVTGGDTNKIMVSINVSIKARMRAGDNLKSILYMVVTGSRMRERLSLGVVVPTKLWNAKSQRITGADSYARDVNLTIESMLAKANEIQVQYRLMKMPLTPITFRQIFQSALPLGTLSGFISAKIEEQRGTLKSGTIRRHRVIVSKLDEFDRDSQFTKITPEYIERFRQYWAAKGNTKTTINGNISVLKKYLRMAKKMYFIPCELDQIKVGSTIGNRTFLTSEELRKLCKYYSSDFITERHKKGLSLFLFACFTGLRFGDCRNLQNIKLLENRVTYVAEKTGKSQTIAITTNCRRVIDVYPEMFQTMYTNKFYNDIIREACKVIGVTKSISFHCGRHTFAMQFLTNGGTVENLQKLLGHYKIDETMIYVHITTEEANKQLLATSVVMF